MGKHDKVQMDWSDGVVTADDQKQIMIESYTMAEVARLKAENERLRTTIKALERDVNRMDRLYDTSSEKVDDLIAKKDKEIAFWKYKALKLVEQHV